MLRAGIIDDSFFLGTFGAFQIDPLIDHMTLFVGKTGIRRAAVGHAELTARRLRFSLFGPIAGIAIRGTAHMTAAQTLSAVGFTILLTIR